MSMRMGRKKVVILGGTRGMGRALARLMAERGDRIFLLGRDTEDLPRSASDLRARGAADLMARGATRGVGYAICDLEQPEGFDEALDAAHEALDGFDTVVVTAGLFASQDDLEKDRDRLARLLDVNFSHTVLFCEAARERLLAHGGGTLCVFSSVAGDRGRKPTGLYGASKAGLSRYL
jgi:decaprenylphospho-beta-D-erythro-pentofuranosid-2-ulose 2-reductase